MEPPDLPVEILHDIFSRTEPVTLVRCAATAKFLRRLITDPDFLRGQLLRKNADGRFVPSLLVGLFFHDDDEARRFLPVPPSSKLKLSLAAPNDNFHPFMCHQPVSRAGLVVLRRLRRIGPGEIIEEDLCVCCPVTGHYTFLPRGTLYGHSHVLLPAGDGDEDEQGNNFCGLLRDEGARRSFRLLVLDSEVRTQTFSSTTGAWGPVTEPPTHLDLPNPTYLARSSALVLRGVAHWLYERYFQQYAVLAINVGNGQATATEVPQRCLRRRRREVPEELLLVRSVDGRLGLLVAEVLAIAMWTLSEDSSSWARRVVVDRERMLQPLTLNCNPLCCLLTVLECFGEASGAVILQLQGAGILLLDLQTGEISQLRKDHDLEVPPPLGCCPYEMDMVSLLAAMKRF